MNPRQLVTVLTLLNAGAACQAQFFQENFEGGVNTGGWTFGAPVEGIQTAGGFSGAYLRGSMLDTTIPFLHTGIGVSSPFVGNYRTARRINNSASLTVFATDFPIGDRPPALILWNDNGTPTNSSDDWGAYKLNTTALGVGGQWRGFSWSIPYDQTSLPAGWTMIDFGPNVPPGRNWNTLIQDVDRLVFSFGDPSLFYIFQMWDVGVDLITIQSPACYINCDQSTIPPCLNINDFVCFIGEYAAGSSYANCDNSSLPPVLNVLDYACFVNKYAAGCASFACEPRQ